MITKNDRCGTTKFAIIFSYFLFIVTSNCYADDKHKVFSNNFGLPGIIDLPSALKFPDGELIVTQQLHSSLARVSISFQALPRLGFSFRYSGHGTDGREAHGRVNHDRSFDAHLSIKDEGKYWPAISIGLRDFIGTGWYSAEYMVATKTYNNFELTAGLGYGRLAGRDTFSNPLGNISSKFKNRLVGGFGTGGALGNVNWFQGKASAFYGINYQFAEELSISLEYTPDLMLPEASYLKANSPWNYGIKYRVNDYVNVAAEYLHEKEFSLTAKVSANPDRPPFLGGRELAPVPMRFHETSTFSIQKSNKEVIRRVLEVDKFEILALEISNDTAVIDVVNTKFRSTAQAIGRIASTLQRFTSDSVTKANISFYSQGLKLATYRLNLQKLAQEQFSSRSVYENNNAISASDEKTTSSHKFDPNFFWGLGPYVTHRLFNPDLPLSMELGLELEGAYYLSPGFKISGAVRKSLLTNLTDNNRRSNSTLPRVHSDWPLYDISGQPGHIHDLKLSYLKNIAPGLYGKLHAGLLEPFFAGIGGEILYKPAKSSFAIGLDMHHVKKRDYDMRFDLLEYETTLGHFSVYYDAGEMFDIEVNAGKYLAGDWGATTTISRTFGSGWRVGGYATLTDIPFETFGEGSFDKAIFVSIPIDWITSSPGKNKRRLTIRPITRDGGANLESARSLYRQILTSQNASFKREYGRLWK